MAVPSMLRAAPIVSLNSPCSGVAAVLMRPEICAVCLASAMFLLSPLIVLTSGLMTFTSVSMRLAAVIVPVSSRTATRAHTSTSTRSVGASPRLPVRMPRTLPASALVGGLHEAHQNAGRRVGEHV